MDTPISWIKAYVPDLECTPQEYADKMTLSGSNMESITYLDKNLEKIVVGKILKIEKHPDADKLIICQVDVGTETVQIVTGAPNVSEGDLVPVVLDGGRVAGGHDGGKNPENGIKIKKGKLRGIESCGMMCSIEELGSNRDMYPEAPEYGIYIFQKDVKPGDDAVEALGLRDAVVEFEITSNRVDCFSMIGMAREAAATFRKDFYPPVVTKTGNDEDVNDYIKVTVEDQDLCPRYTARVVKNIKLAPSPEWMQRRLSAMGIRPINNLVDITNYVMEEYGQPMHAYDLETIANKEIIVRRAKKGDKFVTLDGEERTMDDSVLMICDGEKEIGIAGIMGGENSMVTDNIQTLLFEAACFDGTNIRLSSKKIGLRTDASGKFEKGLDPENAMAAMDRACQLIEELGAGEVVGGAVDVYPNPKEQVRLPLEVDKMNALLGTNVSKEEVLEYFNRLELKYDEAANELLIPSFRQDLGCMADLAEEVARFFGYDNIPVTLPRGEATAGKKPFKIRVEDVCRDVAERNGFSGGMTYSFESPKVFDKLLLAEDAKERQAIEISNPLGEDFSIMRTISLNGMLTSLATNLAHRNTNVRLYEFGNIYIPKELPLTELPDERMQMTLGMYGDCDFFTLKGVLEDMMEALGLKGATEYLPTTEHPFLHPGRQADVMLEGEKFAYIGQIHPEVMDNYSMKGEVYVAVIDMPVLVEKATFDRKYEGVAKFPAMKRDLSMVMRKDIFVGQIEKIFKEKGGKLLESFELFDVYEGNQIEEGYKSVAYSLTFRAKDRTLEEAEVSKIVDKILGELKKLGIELRA
ncbi:phenylalanine--tRNA ligase subunit beta [Anaerostipes sp.]|uniref:phenylalanine--tRNA ligase subunit beta n=1 Tax=Anaerostipes sp. TaxID=1872530 RepID=UPI00258CA04A|nr:phenylalanine--tRNA ligase subunit beta [Anaerostipes sp.]MCI5624059.1 phenylalanine--tRNA ligase subunit beta [Anaerostipes sp.]MDY2725605.1 phenylalanine--tRNA ligase subunit beta [Anaerostipes faecalis]